MSRFIRTTPPASAVQLRSAAADVRAEIAALQSEERDANAALGDLVGDPAYAEVDARARELRFLIPSKRDTLAKIEDAITAAEKRERLQRIVEHKADLERRTNKLDRTAERRWMDAAEALSSIANELRENEREWAALGREARELGEQGGHSAEYRARGNLTGARQLGVFKSLLRETKIPNWHGGPALFDGDPQPRP